MIDIPGYRTVRMLGKGGMASVYLAIQESFGRKVALKVMNPALSADVKFGQRFLSEAKIVSQLIHPNIVTVYDVGISNEQHYLSMEYVPGVDLKTKRTALTINESLRVIKDVAKALDYASMKGYVHRDVKPENIMLHEEDGRAVLMDFGIACLADKSSGMTQTGTAIGTPHYMSPEQAKGRAVDSRSDIYSLGVVLFLLVAGRVPYDADSAVAVGIKHISEPIPRLPQNIAVLQSIIDKLLAKEPLSRFQTGAELVAAIEQLQNADAASADSIGSRRAQSGVGSHLAEAPTLISSTVQSISSKSGLNPKTSKFNPDNTTMPAVAVPPPERNKIRVTKSDINTLSGRQAVRTTSGQTPVPKNVGFSKTTTGNTGFNKTSSGEHKKNNSAGVKVSDTSGKIKASVSGVSKAAPRKNKNAREEVVSIDRDEVRTFSKTKSSRIFISLLIAGLFVSGIAGSVYFKQYLPMELQSLVDTGTAQTLEIRNNIYARLGWPVPEESLSVADTQNPIGKSDVENNDVENSSLINSNSENSSSGNSNSLETSGSLRKPDLENVSISATQEATDRAQAGQNKTELNAAERNNEEALASAESGAGETEIDYERLLADVPVGGELEKARILRERLNTDLQVAPQLAELYRALLVNSPDDKKAEWGLVELKEFHFRKVREYLNSRDISKTKAYLTSLEKTFGEVSEDEKYQQLVVKFDNALKAEEFIEKGNQLVEKDQFTSPKGNNALESFQRALAIDDGNPKATAGIGQILQQYESLSELALKEGDIKRARDLADRGLKINAADSKLNVLYEAANSQLQQQESIESYFTEAEKQIAIGNLLSPVGESAYHQYQNILSIDKNNSQVARALKGLEQIVSIEIESLINRSEYPSARELLANARSYFSSSEKLLAIQVSLEKAQEADILAHTPSISRLVVSNKPIENIDQPMENTSSLDRTIYVGFSYEKFRSDTTVVQAILYDMARSFQIAQVPVVVNDVDGFKVFTIDRPVEGFSEGGYNLDLLVDQKMIGTLAFRVENRNASETSVDKPN